MTRFASIRRLPLAQMLGATIALGLVMTPTSTFAAGKARPAVKAKAKAKPRPAVSVQRSMPLPGTLRSQRTMTDLPLSVGRGQLINLPSPIADVFVANDKVADVQVRSATQIYVFAKEPGESSVFATSSSGNVVYSATVRSGQNINSIDSMLKLAIPDATIQTTAMNGLVLLTGTVAGPDDSAEAERLVQAFVGEGSKVISRLRTSTPLQVNLMVKIAEVNRALVKEIGVNLANRDIGGGIATVLSQGRNFVDIKDFDVTKFAKVDASAAFGLTPGTIQLPFDPTTGKFITGGTQYDFKTLGLGAGKTSIGLAGKLFGLDFASALDLAETEGLVTTLAQPNLTALSGETASFLAGGEFPVPVQQELGSISIEYKQYGVSLSFTPTVLADGRISMRVRPEVSELTNEGAIRINGFDVPGITTRRVETTVELGSGQAFMIGGLMRNAQTNSIDRAPGLGNVPVLGAMFRSTRYRKSETELVIVVTPYLVKPVNANQIALPTDGLNTASDLERILLGRTQSGSSGAPRPKPSSAPATTIVAPSVGAFNQSQQPQPPRSEPNRRRKGPSGPSAVPGFSGN